MGVYKNFHAAGTGESPASCVRRFTAWGGAFVSLGLSAFVAAQTIPATLPTTAPATAPTTQSASTQPSTRPSARREVLPPEYSVLTTRSMFMKGRVPERLESVSNDPFANSTTQPARKGEELIVFNGVTDVDGTLAAFIEDTSQGKASIYRNGDSIAQGKIVSISLDALEYQRSDGRTVKVLIGQTLSGGEAAPVAERATAPTGTGTGAGSSAPGGLSDTLEKMRQKRQQQGR